MLLQVVSFLAFLIFACAVRTEELPPSGTDDPDPVSANIFVEAPTAEIRYNPLSFEDEVCSPQQIHLLNIQEIGQALEADLLVGTNCDSASPALGFYPDEEVAPRPLSDDSAEIPLFLRVGSGFSGEDSEEEGEAQDCSPKIPRADSDFDFVNEEFDAVFEAVGSEEEVSSVGRVVECLLRKTGQTFWAKRACPEVLKEAAVLMRVRHDSVLRPVKIFYDSGGKLKYLVFEKTGMGSLQENLESAHSLSSRDSRYFFRCLAAAIHYLHFNNIAHRNINLQNICLGLDRSGRLLPKLSGFGDAVSDAEVCRESVGQVAFRAPEMFFDVEREGYDLLPADMWALGIVMFAVSHKRLPWTNDLHEERQLATEIILRKVVCAKTLSSSRTDLIQRLLDPNHKIRISAQDTVKHRFIAKKESGRTQVCRGMGPRSS